MNANIIAKEITQREGLKVELSIAQVKEVLGIVAEMMATDPEYRDTIIKLGKRRLARQVKGGIVPVLGRRVKAKR